ncbi:MAG: DHA2 family efflux MFS transporter permease subunit [Acetobacteraceae bacterium]|nr:DHA2 family efflux MFS transporter permease subunit [Acetobacteraceae bacterium]
MADNSNRTSARTRLTASIVACAFFMQNLDSTVIATALPTMAKAFGSDPIHMNIALTAYLLSLAVFIPSSGWMADRFGTRVIFRAAIAVFTLGSVLCGLSESLPALVGARILQGAGGAMMVPVGRMLILRTTPKHELIAAMAWLTTPALIGPVLGPPIGGFIVTYFSWRWIFYINVPIGALGMVLVSLFVENVKEPGHGALDWRGQILCGLGLAGLMFGLQTVGRGVIPPEITALLLTLGALSTGAFIWHANRHPAPLMDFSLLREKTYATALYAMSLFRIGIGAIPFLLPLMLQLAFGETAAQSGMITFASSAGALVMKPVAQRALRWWGFRDTLFWNALLSAILLAACASFRPTWPAAAIFAVLLVGGFFRSLQFTAYNTLAYADIPHPRISAATSMYSTIQQVALTAGVAIGATALELTMLAAHHDTPQPVDFSIAFLVIASFCAASAPFARLLSRDAGAALTGRGG